MTDRANPSPLGGQPTPAEGALGTPSGLAPKPDSQGDGVIIDMHTHLWSSLNQLGEEAARWVRQTHGDPWDRPDTSTTAYDEAMSPVRHAVILGLMCKQTGASITADQVAGYVARKPDKYLGFAGVDPMSPGFLQQVDLAVRLGLVGVTASPAGGGYHPSDTRAMRLYERCERQGLPVVFHPGTHLGPAAKMEFSQPYLLDEVAQAFPGLRMVVAGMGQPWPEQALELVTKHEQCYADLSDLTGRPWQLYNVLLLAYQRGVTHRLLFGSDFPFTTPQQAILNIYSVNMVTHGTRLPVVPRELLRGIVERDALGCLGIARPKPVVTQGETDAGAPASPAQPATTTRM